MNSSFFSKNQFKLNEIDSTNKFLIDLDKIKHFKEPVVVTAEFQTRGKGRKTNSWESNRSENLLISILFKHKLNIEKQFLFSATVSLSILELISEFTNEKVYIKWPNDILISDRKVAGFIIENLLQKNIIHTSVVGIGININQRSFNKYNPEATSLSIITNSEYNILLIKDKFLKILEKNYKKMDVSFIKKYNKYLFMKNNYMSFKINNKITKAKIVSVNKNGVLLLKKRNNINKKFEVNQIEYVF